jgi:hypothetical protein
MFGVFDGGCSAGSIDTQTNIFWVETKYIKN